MTVTEANAESYWIRYRKFEFYKWLESYLLAQRQSASQEVLICFALYNRMFTGVWLLPAACHTTGEITRKWLQIYLFIFFLNCSLLTAQNFRRVRVLNESLLPVTYICLFADISALPTGRPCVKFDYLNFYKNLSRISTFG